MRSKSKHTLVLLRGEGTGGITKADIERRAGELAFIRDGHSKYTDTDLETAQRELFGDTSPASQVEDASSDAFLTRDPSDPRATPGHQLNELSPDEDEENEEPERLAIQGVEEAQHDLMIRARERSVSRDQTGEGS